MVSFKYILSYDLSLSPNGTASSSSNFGIPESFCIVFLLISNYTNHQAAAVMPFPPVSLSQKQCGSLEQGKVGMEILEGRVHYYS